MAEQGAAFRITLDGMVYETKLDDLLKNLTANEEAVLERIGNIKGVNEIGPAMSAGSLRAVVAILGILMARKGTPPNFDKLLEVPLSEFDMESVDPPTEEEATPPTPETSGPPPSDGSTTSDPGTCETSDPPSSTPSPKT